MALKVKAIEKKRGSRCEVNPVSFMLLHVVDDLHEFLSEFVGLRHRLGLAVDTDDGLGV